MRTITKHTIDLIRSKIKRNKQQEANRRVAIYILATLLHNLEEEAKGLELNSTGALVLYTITKMNHGLLKELRQGTNIENNYDLQRQISDIITSVYGEP